jgi:hypothetical protein
MEAEAEKAETVDKKVIMMVNPANKVVVWRPVRQTLPVAVVVVMAVTQVVLELLDLLVLMVLTEIME